MGSRLVPWRNLRASLAAVAVFIVFHAAFVVVIAASAFNDPWPCGRCGAVL